jgi:hypothetical protein
VALIGGWFHDGIPVYAPHWSALRTRADLALEDLALRQQLANLRRTSGRPWLRRGDRVQYRDLPLGSLKDA